MGLQLFGDAAAPCTRTVIAVLDHLKRDYELVPVLLGKAEQRTPEHIARQPFGQVPVLVDDGFVLYESQAICHYVRRISFHEADVAARAQDRRQRPRRPADRPQDLQPLPPGPRLAQLCALVHLRAHTDLLADNLMRPSTIITVEGVFKPAHGMPGDDALLTRNVELLDKALDGYERILSKQAWLAGDHLTLADFFVPP